MSCTVTLHTVVVVICWIAGLSLAVANAFVGPDLGALAVAFLVGGATLAIHGRLERHDADWTTAYEAGKEVARVRQLR